MSKNLAKFRRRCAETMLPEAYDLGISSCIVSRAEETFGSEAGAALLREWGVPENYIARCFVTPGYCDGEYPRAKPRRAGRVKEALIKSTGQLGEQVFRLLKAQKRRNTLCISRFWGEDRRNICRRDVLGDLFSASLRLWRNESKGGEKMTQAERRNFLIERLLAEQPRYRGMAVPEDAREQRKLLRSLMNVRLPGGIGGDFLAVQDEYLRRVAEEKGIVELSELTAAADGLYLWQGDITRLRCDAIVNAANSGMTGCYIPCHGCIDNCIHTYAGVQLRLECAGQMAEQGREEETGKARITPGYNLPCRFVLHTVGPIVSGALTRRHEEQLRSCYRSCLELAERHGLCSVAFCCISTGEFHFPNERAAEIAVRTVREYLAESGSGIKVVFNVFKDLDYEIYRGLLAAVPEG